MDDFSKALESLREMMSTQQGQESVNSLINGLTGSNAESKSEKPASMPSGLPAELGNYGNLLAKLQSGNKAPRMQLMNALKPYLSTRRRQKYEVIMNLMKYSDLPSALFGKNFRR